MSTQRSKQPLELITRTGALLAVIIAFLVACSANQPSSLFPAPEVEEISVDGDTIIIAPGIIKTITTATKIIGQLTGNKVDEHDSVRIINPDGRTINIDVDCKGASESESGTQIDFNTFTATIDFGTLDVTPPSELTIINESRSTTYILPLKGDGTIEINWGDGSPTATITDPDSSINPATHEYHDTISYTITVTGNLENAMFEPRGIVHSQAVEGFLVGYDPLTSVESWGPFQYQRLNQAFANRLFLEAVPNYLPIGITEIEAMFYDAVNFSGDISEWNTSSLTNMSGTFIGAIAFNGNIGGWDVSNVIDMDYMFNYAAIFNQDLIRWCVSEIPGKPQGFATGSALEEEHMPDWGSCPGAPK